MIEMSHTFCLVYRMSSMVGFKCFTGITEQAWCYSFQVKVAIVNVHIGM